MAEKDSEYGGADTGDTLGIQPSPHKLTADEKLRVAYSKDPGDTTFEAVGPYARLDPDGVL